MGIIHRDIKPENVLLQDNSKQFKIKLVDYGSSRSYESVQKVTKKAATVFNP